MNLVLLLSIISVTQLPLFAFGKSPSSKVFEATSGEDPNNIKREVTPSNDDRLRTRRNSEYDDDDFLITKLSREYVTSNLLYSTSACNNWNDDVESDTMIESALRRLFDTGCLEYCRLKVLSDINDQLKCADLQKSMERGSKRAKLDFSNADDLFVPVRGRKSESTPPQLSPGLEKKAKLDLILNDHPFLPHRGRRDMNPKNMPLNPLAKRTGFELNEKDFFVPHRGKRPRVIIPKSQTTFVKYPMDPWLLRSIISVDRNMIDRLRDSNQLGIEANKDITANAAEKFIPRLDERRRR